MMQGIRILITAGPTVEPLDPVRYLSNHSSGKQGYAIAEICMQMGAEVTLVSGSVNIPAPPGVQLRRAHTALEMLEQCQHALPVDIAICTAAVCDWRPAHIAQQKMKKQHGEERFSLELIRNPDILATLSKHPKRPKIVIGFAAETEHHLHYARQKLADKACDAIVVNDVSPEKNVFGSDSNHLKLLLRHTDDVIDLGQSSKTILAKKLMEAIQTHLFNHGDCI